MGKALIGTGRGVASAGPCGGTPKLNSGASDSAARALSGTVCRDFEKEDFANRATAGAAPGSPLTVDIFVYIFALTLLALFDYNRGVGRRTAAASD